MLKSKLIISNDHLSKLREQIYLNIFLNPHLNKEFYDFLEEIQEYESKVLGEQIT